MIALELKTENTSQEMVKAYLEENASEILAQKINNGVTVERDGKKLVMKKDLNGFWKYASQQAIKQNVAYIDNSTVYGWAIHYFEEDDIEGTLYNEDGTPYKPAPAPVKTTSTIPTYTPPAPKPKPQMSSFDDLLKTEQTANAPTMPEADDKKTEGITLYRLTDTDDEETDAEDEPDDKAEGNDKEEPDDALGDDETEEQGAPIYQCYKKFAEKYPGAVLFLRLGDFYEALGGHAVKISNALDLTLTGRDCGLKSRVPMCGVPYHAFETYLAKLLNLGYQVAVAEDLTSYRFAGENNSRIDEETGEVLPAEPQTEQDEDVTLDDLDTAAFDVEALCILSDLFGDDIDVR